MKNEFYILSEVKRILSNSQFKMESLERELLKLQEMENKIEALVKLFNIISRLEDHGSFFEEIFKLKRIETITPLKSITNLELLQQQLSELGRSNTQVNQTKFGQEVSAENVLVLDVDGKTTKKASYFLNREEILKKNFRPDLINFPANPQTEWEIISEKCERFINYHCNEILKTIGSLKASYLR